jgi:RecB family exonuclease
VRWLVERVLRPQPTEPDPEPMRRGSLAHALLEQTLRHLRERSGSARLTSASLPHALEALARAVDDLRAPATDTPARATLRRIEVDAERYLRHEAECGAGMEPTWLEWSFGGEEDEHGALVLAEAGGIAVSGRVDRIDVDAGGRAVVRDYKGRNVTAGARWTQDRRIQAGLYAYAVRDLLGLEPAGALYQPLGAPDQRPRGLVRDDVPGAYVNGDVVDVAAFEAGLAETRAVAAEAAAAMRAGRIRPCPDRCTPRGGCAYPGICRAAEAPPEEA